ncbi:unnamed protein product [Symbiodinium microadriaticum]|nr:unnamed protein product [Symbiodinium microadriaticum]
MKGMDEAVESLSSLMLEVQRIEEKYKMLQQHCEELESNSVSVSNEQYEERITTLQHEFDEMSASNQNLLHQHTSMTIKINQGQEALQRAKDELDTAECDKEMLQAQFEEMSRANEILIAKNNKLQADIRASEAAEIRANEEATVFERAARSAEAIAKQHLAAVRDMEKVVNEIEADRLVHVSAHGSLLRLVDKEKVKNIEDSAGHQFQVVVLLLLIWVLMLGLIYEVNIDLRPSTHDAVRITY